MNTLLLEHFAAVSKIAAYRQSRERQQGVDVSQGYLRSTDAGLLFDGPRTLEVFFNYQRSTAYQRPAGFTADTLELEIPASNDTLVFYCGRGRVQASIVDGQDYHAAISYDGDTATAYLNGVVVGTITPVNYLVPPAFNIGNATYPPKGTIYFARIYNYALSVDEVSALWNNGDPAGYVLPNAIKGLMPVEIVGDNSYTWTGVDDRYEFPVALSRSLVLGMTYRFKITVSDYEAGDPFLGVGTSGNPHIPAENGVHEIEATIVRPNNTMYIYGGARGTDRRLTLTVNSIEPLGCVAEYLPQNLIVASKQDFPQVVFPDGVYTPGANVFGTNDPELTAITNDNPASHGFSGSFQRGEAIISLGIRCAFHNRSENIDIPIKLTVEYRSNISLYQYTGQGLSAEPLLEPNEGDAKIATFVYGAGNGFLMGKSSVAGDWLEIRTLSIKVAEGAVLSWLDSAKQLPLNDEYLPPLLETAGGYNLTANGAPEIVYKPE